jgi:hypothetical protein
MALNSNIQFCGNLTDSIKKVILKISYILGSIIFLLKDFICVFFFYRSISNIAVICNSVL